MARERKREILFVSHKANRSGAPVLLLEIIKEFKRNSGTSFRILSMENGELVKEFEQLASTYVWKISKKSPSNFINHFFSRFTQIVRAAKILFYLRNTTLIFYNTISNGHIQKKLSFFKSRSICYVHELEAAIYFTTNMKSLHSVIENTNLYIACSEAVKNNLTANHNIPEDSVRVFNSPIRETYRFKKDHKEFICSFRKEHNIAEDATIIGVAASNEWRKGFDLFFPLATLYFYLFPNSNTYFVWKGFRRNDIYSFHDFYDVKKYEGNNRIKIIPHGNDNIETMACFDVHLLLSREDPYPLVTLEAASFSIPTVCFSDSGGAPEFVGNDCGFSVPYGDLMAMALRLHSLVTQEELRKNMGQNARNKLKEKHSIEITIPSFIEVLEKF